MESESKINKRMTRALSNKESTKNEPLQLTKKRSDSAENFEQSFENSMNEKEGFHIPLIRQTNSNQRTKKSRCSSHSSKHGEKEQNAKSQFYKLHKDTRLESDSSLSPYELSKRSVELYNFEQAKSLAFPELPEIEGSEEEKPKTGFPSPFLPRHSLQYESNLNRKEGFSEILLSSPQELRITNQTTKEAGKEEEYKKIEIGDEDSTTPVPEMFSLSLNKKPSSFTSHTQRISQKIKEIGGRMNEISLWNESPLSSTDSTNKYKNKDIMSDTIPTHKPPLPQTTHSHSSQIPNLPNPPHYHPHLKSKMKEKADSLLQPPQLLKKTPSASASNAETRRRKKSILFLKKSNTIKIREEKKGKEKLKKIWKEEDNIEYKEKEREKSRNRKGRLMGCSTFHDLDETFPAASKSIGHLPSPRNHSNLPYDPHIANTNLQSANGSCNSEGSVSEEHCGKSAKSGKRKNANSDHLVMQNNNKCYEFPQEQNDVCFQRLPIPLSKILPGFANQTLFISPNSPCASPSAKQQTQFCKGAKSPRSSFSIVRKTASTTARILTNTKKEFCYYCKIVVVSDDYQDVEKLGASLLKIPAICFQAINVCNVNAITQSMVYDYVFFDEDSTSREELNSFFLKNNCHVFLLSDSEDTKYDSIVKQIFPKGDYGPSFRRMLTQTIEKLMNEKRKNTNHLSPLVFENGIEKKEVKISYVPNCCAMPIIVAELKGYYKRNGVNATLKPVEGWSGIRDLLLYGYSDLSHLPCPMVVACNLGIQCTNTKVKIAAVLNVNGQNLVLSKKYIHFTKIEQMKGLTIGVPHLFSVQYYFLCHLLAMQNIDPQKDVKIIEITCLRMEYFFKMNSVDAVFLPEPFSQIAVNKGEGFVFQTSQSFWDKHPCCCLATTETFIEKYPNTYQAILKSVLDAQRDIEKASTTERGQIGKEIFEKFYLRKIDLNSIIGSMTGKFKDGRGSESTSHLHYQHVDSKLFCKWIISQMQRWGQLNEQVDEEALVNDINLRDAELIQEEQGIKTISPVIPQIIKPFTGSHGFDYMKTQNFCLFKPQAKGTALTNVNERLEMISRQIAKVSAGREISKIEITGNDEIGLLEQILNSLLSNLRSAKQALEENYRNIQEASRSLKLIIKKTMESEKKYKYLFEHADIGIFKGKVNPLTNSLLHHSDLQTMNAKFLEIAGLDSKEQINEQMKIFQYKNPEDEKRIIDLFQKQSKVIDFELQILSWSNNQVKTVLLSLKNDGYSGFDATIVDITYKKELEKAKLEAEARSDLLSSVSHEIRNPLNAIVGIINSLSNEPMNPDQIDSVEHMKTASDILLKLVTKVLDYTKIEKGKIILNFDSFKLRNLCKEAQVIVGPIAKKKKIDLSIECQPQIADMQLIGDSYRIMEIIDRLTANAIKFSEKGEVKVSISSTNFEDSPICIKILVQDEGMGIPEHLKAYLFQPFSQKEKTLTSHSGSGLGLALVKETIEAMGGKINLKSEENKGTEVLVELSLDKAGEQSSSHESSQDQLQLGNNQDQLQLLRNLNSFLEESANTKSIYHPFKNKTYPEALPLYQPHHHHHTPTPHTSKPQPTNPKPSPQTHKPTKSLTKSLTKTLSPTHSLSKSLSKCLNKSLSSGESPTSSLPLTVPSSSSAFRILLVDDQDFNRYTLRLILKKYKLENIKEARDGEEAVQMWRRNDFNLIVMDVRMPNKDGFTATREIRSEEASMGRRHVPIVGLTGDVTSNDKSTGFSAGMDFYLSKPLCEHHFVPILNTILEVQLENEAFIPVDNISQLRFVTSRNTFTNPFN